MPQGQEMARWLREQHDKVEVLSAELRERVAVVPKANVDQWLMKLIDQFERYRAHFEKHMALEQEGGYFAPVLERRPGLSAEVQRLLTEHREIAQLMTLIYTGMAHLSSMTPLLIQDCCSRILNLITIIADHEDQENLLVSQVFSEDIGASD